MESVVIPSSYAQELPPFKTFTSEIYNGSNQNWDISQAESGDIYVANNEGLLAYNGSTWQIYPVPNNTIVRAVRAIESRIYTGCYMDFGYWQKDANGELFYTSISKDLEAPMIEDEHIWRIFSLDNYVLFQSLNRVYIHNTQSLHTSYLDTDGIFKMYELDGVFYFQDTQKRVYKIKNGQIELVKAFVGFNQYNIISLFQIDKGLLILTEKDGFFKLQDDTISPWKTALDDVLGGLSIYNAIRLNDGSIMIGTISKGLIQLDPQGMLILELDKNLGLENNTVLSLFEDANQNVWAGLDNGVAVININAPVKFFNDKDGSIGAVYANVEFNDRLYLGTNQGLFVSTDSKRTSFEFVKGTNGQVWSLFVHDNVLFCGHNEGTFVVNGSGSAKISDFPGTWNFQTVPEKDGFILQGNYTGLSYLQKIDNNWKFGGVFEGFDISARYLEREDQNTYWINHEYKGIYKLSLDFDTYQVINAALDTVMNKGIHSGLTRYRNQIIYSYKEGVFTKNKGAPNFKRDSVLSAVWDSAKNYISGKIIVDSNDNLWAFNSRYVNLVRPNSIGNAYRMEQLPLASNLRNLVTNFENISQTSEGVYVLGTNNGYLTLETDNFKNPQTSIRIETAQLMGRFRDSTVKVFDKPYAFEPQFNAANFSFTTPVYDAYLVTEYQHRMRGAGDGQWSDWSKDHTANYANLNDGDYEFEVRSRQGDVLSENVASFTFRINTPWFRSTVAYIFYILGFAALIAFVHNLYTNYYRKQRERLIVENEKQLAVKQLEAERQIVQLRNESLRQAVESKNKELAISTMAMIKKNELLNTIKKELQKHTDQDNSKGVKEVTEIIDQNLLNKKEWKVFEEAFNNTDKDFITKLKTKHPSLTSNDVRLCSFLRLNLSSKEIAPLLNISPRSVEIKRYRLRKKMELDSSVNLSNYILQI
ncbi:MAG: LuxR C-terminal-related transcriptional regulator [Gilvibacter sp.]